jgi:putative spermidine/putrescine transport system ATP-binding protein
MAKVKLQHLQKKFGTSVAVADFSLDIADGEFVAFLGPSGCGKTTTLRMIAGFIEPTAGQIFMGDQEVTHLPVHKRGTGMVFQRYALFPHMTVAENVSFGLEMHKVQGAQRDERIENTLDMVRMTALRDRYPRQLSGGQQQRVAIARALAIQPKVFLLDEPLSNLDAKLRLEVREEIRALQRKLGLTTIFVTHDQEEALSVADRIAIMHDGIVQQVGTPDEVYEQPCNLFVADFLGKMNLFGGHKSADAQFQTSLGATFSHGDTTVDTPLTIGVRPERIRLCSEPQGVNTLNVTVTNVVYLGSLVELTTKVTGTETKVVVQLPNTATKVEVKEGQTLYACFEPEDCVLFSESLP